MEIWKDIKDYEGYYQISNYGRVKNIQTNYLLNGDINSAGYKRVVLYTPKRKRFFIHRLVALNFCNGYSENLVVNHIDGNKLNNHYMNLEWITRSENDLHAEKIGLRKNHYIPQKPKYMIRTFDLLSNKTIKIYNNREEFCAENGFAKSSVQNMLVRGYFGKNENKIGIETALKFQVDLL